MESATHETITRLAQEVQRLDKQRQAAAAHRDEAMRAVRQAGSTWREIAIAAGMTEHGVRKALGRSQ